MEVSDTEDEFLSRKKPRKEDATAILKVNNFTINTFPGMYSLIINSG